MFTKHYNTGSVIVIEADLKKKILTLLREDEEFRLAVAGLLGLDEILRRLDRNDQRILELIQTLSNFIREQEKRWEENNKRWEENNRRWEEAYKRFEAIELELKRLREDMNRLYARVDSLEKRIIAIGARWGYESEETFREAMRGIVEELLGTVSVSKWIYYDEEGVVFGYPSQVEADLLIKDKVHIIVEIKSSVSAGDVAKLWRIGNLYQRVTGIKPRLVIVSPFIDQRALEVAEKLKIEIYTKP